MIFLGVDVGGTHCRCEWWPAGAAAGGDAVSAQPAVRGVEATIASLGAVLAQAAGRVSPTAAVCAVAGAGCASTSRVIEDGLRARGIRFPLTVIGDVLAAAAAALPNGPGLLLWSGTGSFAVVRTANGELVRTGGRGYLLGDQGSGFDLVRRAAAAVLLAVDDLGPATALTETLVAAFGAEAPARLGAVLQRLDSGQIAAQLPVVLAAAAAGDAVANDVLLAGVDGLVMLGAAALRRAGHDWSLLPVVLGGGVLEGAPAVTALVNQRLQALGAAQPTHVDARAAARGAAWLAYAVHHRLEPARSWVQRVAI